MVQQTLASSQLQLGWRKIASLSITSLKQLILGGGVLVATLLLMLMLGGHVNLMETKVITPGMLVLTVRTILFIERLMLLL